MNRAAASCDFFLKIGAGAEEKPEFAADWPIFLRSGAAYNLLLTAFAMIILVTINEYGRDPRLPPRARV